MVASQNGYMYIYSIPLDGGECQLIKKHGKLKLKLTIHNKFSFKLNFIDLKNIDQPTTQPAQQQTLQQQQQLVRPTESMPINVPNTNASSPKSSADD
jgi:hypothetical protein